MFYTARQLEDLFKATGQVVLPYRARLTPAAADWVKARGLTIGYSDVDPAAAKAQAAAIASAAVNPAATRAELPFFWWCDGPCGTAKAAIMAVAREAVLAELSLPADPARIVAVVKQVAADVKAGKSAGGILVVQSGSAALVYANRCPSLRAIAATCLETVEQGIQSIAANVLVIEHPYKTLQQMRNMMGRFVKARRSLSEDVNKALGEMMNCV